MTLLLKSAFLLATLYALVLGLIWFSQERLLFQPQKLLPDHRFDKGTDVHETWVDVPGARLNALHLRHPDPKGIVFFVHGNAGNLDNWFVNVDFYRQANFDLFMFDFRGYGKSGGRIENQAQLEADVRAAWNSIAATYAGKRTVFYGRSLGSGLATRLALDAPPNLLVLVSAYSSMLAVAAQHYAWVPGALLRYPLRTDLLLPQVKSPVLLVHGGTDSLIPPEQSKALHALVPKSTLLVIPEAGHGDIHEFAVYLDTLAAAIQETSPGAPASPPPR